MNDVNSLTNEIDTVKNDLISSVVDSATNVKQTLNDTASEISDSAKQIQATVKDSTTLDEPDQ